MATTSGTLVAGKAITGQGGDGGDKRRGLWAKVAVSMAVLGCAAALTFGGLHAKNTAGSDTAAPVVPQASINHRLSPVGRTGPSDEYVRADFANALPIAERTGPADEYMQGEVTPSLSGIARTGPADEYNR